MITMGRRLALPDMVVLGMVMVGLTGALIGGVIEIGGKTPLSGIGGRGDAEKIEHRRGEPSTGIKASERKKPLTIWRISRTDVLYIVSMIAFLMVWHYAAATGPWGALRTPWQVAQQLAGTS